MSILKLVTSKRIVLAIKGILVMGILSAVSCSGPIDNAPGIPIPEQSNKRVASSLLAPGDVISVAYAGAPEYNLTQKIRADGRVTLPVIGDVAAAGKSPPSLQSSLTSSYKKHLQEPQVMVTVVAAAAGVYVTGEIKQSGKVAVDRPLTVLEAIMESGGFLPTADPTKVSVVRTVNGAHQRFNLNMTDAMTGRARAFYLKPYDVIHVGKRVW